MTKTTKIVLALVTGAAVLGGSAACGASSLTGGGGFKDLEHVKPQDPDKSVLINNVNGFPNVTILCVDGVALITTTREAAGAIQHLDVLDKICPGYTPPTR